MAASLEDAILLAVKAHRGQTDKADAPYILHPLRVMLKMDTDVEKQVAVLHDVLEDTKITAEYLARKGFSKEVIQTVETLSKEKDKPYDEYINRLKSDPVARKVKLADLEDNMDLSRIAVPTEKDFERIKKYKQVHQKLKKEKKYCVYVDDNFHYQDESERYADGIFDTAEEAIAHCKKIVDDSLRHLYRQHPGTAERLYDDYQDFGDDPFIRSDDPNCKFSGWNYAKHRAKDIVAEFTDSK